MRFGPFSTTHCPFALPGSPYVQLFLSSLLIKNQTRGLSVSLTNSTVIKYCLPLQHTDLCIKQAAQFVVLFMSNCYSQAIIIQIHFFHPFPSCSCSVASFSHASHLFICRLRSSNEIHRRRHPLLPLFAFPSAFHTCFNLFAIILFLCGFFSFVFTFFSFFLCSRFYLSSQSSAIIAIPREPLCSVSLCSFPFLHPIICWMFLQLCVWMTDHNCNIFMHIQNTSVDQFQQKGKCIFAGLLFALKSSLKSIHCRLSLHNHEKHRKLKHKLALI